MPCLSHCSLRHWFTLLACYVKLHCHWKVWSSSLPVFLAYDCTVTQVSLLTWWKINLLISVLFFFGNFQMDQRDNPTGCVDACASTWERWKCISGIIGRTGKVFFCFVCLFFPFQILLSSCIFNNEYYFASLAWQWQFGTNAHRSKAIPIRSAGFSSRLDSNSFTSTLN